MSKKDLELVNKYSYSHILKAYLDCRKRKRSTQIATEYELTYERNLKELLESINNKTYKIGQTRVFTVERPKPREIWAAKFPDRIVHHLIYNSIGKHFEKRFIEDTFSCIKGRGTLAAIKRASYFARSITQDWTLPMWYLKMDISNFFVSINRPILWSIVEEQIGDKDSSLTAHLAHQNIFHDPTKNAYIKPGVSFKNIEKRKSLWYSGDENGLPVGNLTSQFYSNVYLNIVDQFAKHVLKLKRYVRYVDDIVVFHEDKEFLKDVAIRYNEFLQEKRNLCLNPKKIYIKRVHTGINFVGQVILPYREYTRRMTVDGIKHSLFNYFHDPLDETNFCSIQSYLGLIKYTNSYNLRKNICLDCCDYDNNIFYDTKYTKLIHA